MATIRERTRKDGRVVYNVQVRVAQYPTKTRSFTDRRKAENWGKVEEAAIIEGRAFRNADAVRRTLAEAIEQFETEKLPHLKSQGMHKSALAWWGKQLGKTKLADVTAPVIVKCRAKLLREKYRRANPDSKRTSLAEGEVPKEFQRTAATANRFVAVLSSLFTAARKEWHWMHSNPCGEIEPLPEKPNRARVLTPAERKSLLEATSTDSTLHLFTTVALHTACRAGELLKLQWADVDVAEGQIIFRDTKNGEERSAWLHGEAKRLFAQHAEEKDKPSDAVFKNPSNRGVYQYAEKFETACERAGLGKFHFHNLRHTAATVLAQQGASESQLKAVGGWQSNAVNRYVKAAAINTKDITKTLSESL
jgi:integrase